ncbi:2195_t:CDS:1, partial [Funneliformis geosporum]
AHLLLQDLTDSTSNNENSNSSEELENDLAILPINTKSTEIKQDINILQIIETENSELSVYAVIDIIDGEIKCCEEKDNLHKLWKLTGMWQLDKFIVESVGKI